MTKDKRASAKGTLEANPPGWEKRQRLGQPWGRGSQTAHRSPNLRADLGSPLLSFMVTLCRHMDPWGRTMWNQRRVKERQQYANEVSIRKRSYLLNEKELKEKEGIFGISEGYSICMASMEC